MKLQLLWLMAECSIRPELPCWMLELPTEWLSLAQLASGHLPTSVIELARILVGGLQCTQAASGGSSGQVWYDLWCVYAMFWHFCSLATVSPGRPASRALFRSKRDVTKAWTIFSHESRSRNLLIIIHQYKYGRRLRMPNQSPSFC